MARLEELYKENKAEANFVINELFKLQDQKEKIEIQFKKRIGELKKIENRRSKLHIPFTNE